jgi:hypothetical protein
MDNATNPSSQDGDPSLSDPGLREKNRRMAQELKVIPEGRPDRTDLGQAIVDALRRITRENAGKEPERRD